MPSYNSDSHIATESLERILILILIAQVAAKFVKEIYPAIKF